MMNELKVKTKAIKELLGNLEIQIQSITSENFDEKFQFSMETMMVIQSIKKELAEKYGIKNLADYDPELIMKAKLIEQSYDNIVGNFRKEVSKLEREISSLNNRKKITKYIR
ncbi:MAG: hypothetical protein AB1521_02905 [Bacteroidota bacterium]